MQVVKTHKPVYERLSNLTHIKPKVFNGKFKAILSKNVTNYDQSLQPRGIESS